MGSPVRHQISRSTYRQRRSRRRVAVRPFLHHLKVVVEGGRLVDIGLRPFQFLGQCGQMWGRKLAKMIVDSVEALDQQVVTRRLLAQEILHFGECSSVDTPAFLGLALGLAGDGQRRSSA